MVYQFQSMLILQESPMLMLLMPVDVPMVLVWVGVMLIVVEDPVSIFERVPHSPKSGKRKMVSEKLDFTVSCFRCYRKCFQKDDFQHDCSGFRESSASKHCECSSATDASC
jgi:hypothetical protein